MRGAKAGGGGSGGREGQGASVTCKARMGLSAVDGASMWKLSSCGERGWGGWSVQLMEEMNRLLLNLQFMCVVGARVNDVEGEPQKQITCQVRCHRPARCT
jgi:hypothetical protein